MPMNLRFRDPSANGRLMELSFGAYHPGGALFGMGDGAVRLLNESIDVPVYAALFSRADGE